MGSCGKSYVLLFHVKVKAPIAAHRVRSRLISRHRRAWVGDGHSRCSPKSCLLPVFFCKPEGAGQIIGPHVSRQPIGRVISDLQGLVFGGKRD